MVICTRLNWAIIVASSLTASVFNAIEVDPSNPGPDPPYKNTFFVTSMVPIFDALRDYSTPLGINPGMHLHKHTDRNTGSTAQNMTGIHLRCLLCATVYTNC